MFLNFETSANSLYLANGHNEFTEFKQWFSEPLWPDSSTSCTFLQSYDQLTGPSLEPRVGQSKNIYILGPLETLNFP